MSVRTALVLSSDCGFGRQGANREIAFYKASAIAQGANIERRELGLPTTYVPAANAILQIDVVPGRDAEARHETLSRQEPENVRRA
jgi:5-methyltetrahydropteroyltriglutamate--homocysteine methyltransferase